MTLPSVGEIFLIGAQIAFFVIVKIVAVFFAASIYYNKWYFLAKSFVYEALI